MKALILSCTLKRSPEVSNTEALADEVIKELQKRGVDTRMIRIADRNVVTGSKSDMGEGDEWPEILKELLNSEILIMATPTWMGTLSSVALRVLERVNGLYPARDMEGRPVTFNRVAGFVVTGAEDGARHVVAEMAAGLMDVGFTIPPQCYTYWNNGPGPGDNYLESDYRKNYSIETAALVAANVVAVAKALQVTPIPPPQ